MFSPCQINWFFILNFLYFVLGEQDQLVISNKPAQL